jgi:hypothetical protein
MTDEDQHYFTQRAAEERQLADAATDPRARAAHNALALRYRMAADAIGTNGQIQAASDAILRSHALLAATEEQVSAGKASAQRRRGG